MLCAAIADLNQTPNRKLPKLASAACIPRVANSSRLVLHRHSPCRSKTTMESTETVSRASFNYLLSGKERATDFSLATCRLVQVVTLHALIIEFTLGSGVGKGIDRVAA